MRIESVMLRSFRPRDFRVLADIRRDIELQNLLMGYPERIPDDASIMAWIDRRIGDTEGMFFLISDSATEEALGFIQMSGIHRKGRHGKFGIAVHRSNRQKGVGLSALMKLELEAKNHDLHKIIAEVRCDNVASLNLCRSAGYSTVGIFRKHYFEYDVFLMEKLI